MKKYVTMVPLAFACFAISCSNKSDSGLSPAAQKNLDAQHGVSKAVETKDFSKLGDYIADDAVDHGGDSGDVKGLANIRAELEKSTAGSENDKMETIKELADDDYVMAWFRATGNYKMAEMGHKAGEKYDVKILELTKFKDGKGIEHWIFMEPGDVMKMMGMQQPKMPMAADSTKK
jgi:ketosteroid isomerase-like protein